MIAMTQDSSGREYCESCSFDWATIDPNEVTPRVNRAVGEFATLLQSNPAGAIVRPERSRWSAVEYGAHLRDVLFNVRDRLILMVVEDTPSPDPIYRDQRVDLMLYADETPAVVASDLETAARLFTTTFDRLRADYIDRTLIYSKFMPGPRTFGWVGAQVLHECEHHRDDARANLAAKK
jgi:hypothetical protein